MKFFSRVAEQFSIFFDVSRRDFNTIPALWTSLRNRWKLGFGFWGTQPAYDNTAVSYDLARMLYRNDGVDFNLGGHVCKPIIDLAADFVGTPSASTENPQLDDFLNDCLRNYWVDVLEEVKRNSMRDSSCVVRLRQPTIDNPLATIDDREHCFIQVYPCEQVWIEYDDGDPENIRRALITTKEWIVDEDGDILNGIPPRSSQHEFVEEITPETFRTYDTTKRELVSDRSSVNTWGFVPLVEVFNEYDSTLHGGQSDLESVYPLVIALHDVMKQTLAAHKQHSVPKVVFRIAEIGRFIQNNFPEAFDPETGKIKAQSQIAWKGQEMIFLEADESAEFLEARSVLGDSKTLMEWLLDCICIASETPKWAFMVVDTGASNQEANAQVLPFVKKVERKRKKLVKPMQRLLKMVMVVNNQRPERATISWEIVRPSDQLAFNTALQQLIMGLEVAKQSGEISDETYREMLRMFIPVMKNPQKEASDAKKNAQPALPAPPSPSRNGNTPQPALAGGPQGRGE